MEAMKLLSFDLILVGGLFWVFFCVGNKEVAFVLLRYRQVVFVYDSKPLYFMVIVARGCSVFIANFLLFIIIFLIEKFN